MKDSESLWECVRRAFGAALVTVADAGAIFVREPLRELFGRSDKRG